MAARSWFVSQWWLDQPARQFSIINDESAQRSAAVKKLAGLLPVVLRRLVLEATVRLPNFFVLPNHHVAHRKQGAASKVDAATDVEAEQPATRQKTAK